MCVFRTLINYYYLIYFDFIFGFILIGFWLAHVSKSFSRLFNPFQVSKKEQFKNKGKEGCAIAFYTRHNHHLLTSQFLIRLFFYIYISKQFPPMTHTAVSFLTVQFWYIESSLPPPIHIPTRPTCELLTNLNPPIQIRNGSIAYIILNIIHVRQLIS